MTVGYIRVSTTEQSTARQETLLKEFGIETLYIDKVSGKTAKREQLQKMLEFVRKGDTVVVESYSRLARSTKDLLNIIELLQSKEVAFISHKEAIDTGTPAGRLMLTIFAGLCQFERECILERQAEGIAEAKKLGKYTGRQPIKYDTDLFKRLYLKWKSGDITAVSMMKQLKLTAATFYRRVKDYEGRK
jgi:DNA invertase Pin-like site-specific DNA recombinase